MRTVVELLQLELKYTEERLVTIQKSIADYVLQSVEQGAKFTELQAHKVQLERALEMIGDF